MAERGSNESSLLSPRKLVVQLVGFVIGVGLLAWCISIALSGDGWERIVAADRRLVVALGACSLVSLFVNGVLFWVVIQPVRPLAFGELQWLNFTCGLLNYAPIRLGLIARVAYHLRVDGIPLLEIGAWFAALAYTLALTLGSCITATIIRPELDLVWGALLIGQLVLGAALTWAIMGQPLVVRYGRGMDRMLRSPRCLLGAIGLRLVDIAVFIARMACAAAILELSLTTTDIVILGLASLTLSLNPLGRTGFREIAVAFVASRLVTPGVTGVRLESDMATLALVESAGEAIVAIPIGAVALFWYHRRWTRGGRETPVAPES